MFRKSSEDENEDMDEDDQKVAPDENPGTSRKRPNQCRRAYVKKNKSKERSKSDRFEEFKKFKVLPEKFKLPDWLTDTQPKRTPYFPQVGDEIVYFRQGHAIYLSNVRNNSIYPVNSKLKPYKILRRSRDEEFGIIKDIKYEVKPPRLVTLKIAVIDPETNELTTDHFSIRYHDMEGVIDFFVLRQVYEQSTRYEWQVGDRFRSLIDDKWWFGKFKKERIIKHKFKNLLSKIFR